MIKSLINLPIAFAQSLFSGFQKILQWFTIKLKQPAHSATLSVRGLVYSSLVALAVFTAFFIAGPAELASRSNTALSGQIAGIAFAGMIFCLFVLPLALKGFYDEHEWTVGKQIIQNLLIVLLTGGAIIFFLNLSRPGAATLLAGVLLISVLPILILSFSLETFFSRKFETNAASIMNSISGQGVVSAENPLNVLVFKTGNEKLSLVPNQLIYVKTGENQSEFFYQNFFGVESTVLPVSEKLVNEELKSHPQFKKFHPEYFVNINGIKNVSGTARGYEIGIAKVNHVVKVSRKYKKGLEQL